MSDQQLTREVQHWLHSRRGVRRAAFRRIGYVVYLVVLVGALYGWPAILWATRKLETEQVRGATGVAVLPALTPGLACLFVLVVLGACRNALWRGPVTLSEADVAWLLPTPLDRTRLLRPRAVRALAFAAAGGAAVGALGALLVNAVHPHAGARVVIGMIGYGCVTGVTAIAAAAVVESSPPAARTVRRFWSWALVLIAVLGLLTIARAGDHAVIGVERIVMWAGPWGWVAQLPVAVDRAPAAGFAALVLAAAATVGVVVSALRSVPSLPAESLRARASVGHRVTTDLAMGDARSARLRIQDARAMTVRTGLHRRPPRAARLVVMWRDSLALARAPGRAVWAAVFVAGATLVAGVGIAVSATHDPAPAALAGAVLVGYAAATALVEVARVDNDAPRVASQLPLRFSDLARRHLAVPATVLAALAGIAAAVVAAEFGSPVGAAVLGAVAAAPVLVAAALVNVYRSNAPLEWSGADPYGMGMTLLVVWFLVGPVLAVVVLVPMAMSIFTAHGPDQSAGASLATFVVCVIATAILMALVSRRAGTRSRAAR